MIVAQILFGFLALIHLVPAAAALAPSRIAHLYGVDTGDATLLTLLQHRAVLLGLVGFAFTIAAVRPGGSVAWHAVLLGGASMLSFIGIAAIRGALNGPLRKIAIVDAVGLLPLAALFWIQPWGLSY